MTNYIKLIVIVFIIPVCAQPERYTKGAENGYDWDAMGNPLLASDNSKENFLSGILQRYRLLKENYPEIEKLNCNSEVESMLKEGKSDEVSLNEMIIAIDDFYMIPENKFIPIILAYCYCIKEKSNMNQIELEQYRQELIKFSEED